MTSTAQITARPICVCLYRVTAARLQLLLSRLRIAEISPATLQDSQATVARDRRCAGPAVGPLRTRRRTFPTLNRDYRCNAAPSLRASSAQLVIPTPSGHDENQSDGADAVAHLPMAVSRFSNALHFQR